MRRFLARAGRLFPRNETVDAVRTTVHFDAPPDAVWREMIFYEEVPRRPAPLLRLFLPEPIRTQGEKTRPGSKIECTYDGGRLEKRITRAEPARFVGFDVILQDLGVEDCITMKDGSYAITADGKGSELVLTTRYCGHLRPRWLWRPFESFLAHRLHRHILDGMRLLIETEVPEALTAEGH